MRTRDYFSQSVASDNGYWEKKIKVSHRRRGGNVIYLALEKVSVYEQHFSLAHAAHTVGDGILPCKYDVAGKFFNKSKKKGGSSV